MNVLCFQLTMVFTCEVSGKPESRFIESRGALSSRFSRQVLL